MDADAAPVDVREGTVPFRVDGETASTWYRVTGELRPDDVTRR